MTGLRLKHVRRHRCLTQAQVAEALGTTQSSVSRTERQTDWLVSTLTAYAEATGGRLRLMVVYPDETVVELGVSHR